MSIRICYTIGETAEMLGISRKTLDKGRSEGRTRHGIVIDHGPDHKPGIGYTLEAINTYISKQGN